MKKYYPLVLLVFLLSACGQTKSPSVASYQIMANSLLYKNTAIVVNTNVYVDRADVDITSSVANAHIEKGIDYLDDSQYVKSNIDLDVDVNTDIESVPMEFPGQKTLRVEPPFATSGGGSSLMTTVTYSGNFVSPPKQWQVGYPVVKIKFNQFDEPVQFKFADIADIALELSQ
jgi:hypothetical protein